jgi:hypothetical protein
MKYRELSTEEIIAITTLNCCANAISDNLPKLARRFKAIGKGNLIGLLMGASAAAAKAVDLLITESPDPDRQIMIRNRMGSLQLQFGYTRKHPDDLVIMSKEDAQILLSPCLDKCDLECPCSLEACNGNMKMHTALVKACETRKALKRIGVSEVGLSMECPYQMMVR